MNKANSFDVFDTILARRCIYPNYVFFLLEEACGVKGLCRSRIMASCLAAVKQEGSHSLEDIYDELACLIDLSKEKRSEIMAMELRIEFDNVIPINENINLLQKDDVLISDRINLPSKRLKGFEKGKVGPKDGNEFIGGNYASAVSLNTTLPKILPDVQALEIGLFLDAGNVWSVDYDSSLDNSKLRSAAGLTIDYFTPIGPINFVFSQPISKSDTDVTEGFRFDIGTSF